MRLLFALPLILTAACNVDNDAGNDQVTLEYNEQQVKDTARDAAAAAKGAASAVGNVAASAGQAIENEVGDIDVDVDVKRNEPANAQ